MTRNTKSLKPKLTHLMLDVKVTMKVSVSDLSNFIAGFATEEGFGTEIPEDATEGQVMAVADTNPWAACMWYDCLPNIISLLPVAELKTVARVVYPEMMAEGAARDSFTYDMEDVDFDTAQMVGVLRSNIQPLLRPLLAELAPSIKRQKASAQGRRLKDLTTQIEALGYTVVKQDPALVAAGKPGSYRSPAQLIE